MDVDEYWSETGGGTNTCGWNGRGSGKRVHDTGLFITLGEQADYWTVPENGTNTALKFYLYGYDDYFSYQTSNDKKNGFSVRPIKDTTTLSHGQTGTYTGNDGRIYRTICIDSQEWLADNLCETKYRNGDTIPEVTDNTAWAALTTGALCAYNNDHNNI